MKLIYRGSAIVAAALISGSFFLSARPLEAETLLSPVQEKAQSLDGKIVQSLDGKVVAFSTASDETISPEPKPPSVPVTGKESGLVLGLAVLPAVSYLATAYSLRGRTASGAPVSKGLIAADPRILPLGSRVRLEAGGYSGEYLVADTGGAVRGRRIDIWAPTVREALRFGRRMVKLTVLSYGRKKSSAQRLANK